MRDAWIESIAALDQPGDRMVLPAAAILEKGLLEAEVPVALAAGPSGAGFGGVFGEMPRSIAELRRAHALEVEPTPTGGRAVDLAMASAAGGSSALAWVPWRDVSDVARPLARAATMGLARGVALVMLLEDAPSQRDAGCPRSIVRAQLSVRGGGEWADPVTFAATELGAVRDLLDTALRTSRALHRVVHLVVHESIGAGAETSELFPNRVSSRADLTLSRARIQRRTVPTDTSDALRVIRRAELNVARCVPSPGERVPVGFITVGPATHALDHVVSVLGLTGRVPHLALGAITPIDTAAAGRLIGRCEHVIVLEPRPGTVERDLLGVAEGVRQSGERAAAIWGRTLPATTAGDDAGDARGAVIDPASPGRTVHPDDAVHPSRLARAVIDLLHVIRPMGRVADRLVADPVFVLPGAKADTDVAAGHDGADDAGGPDAREGSSLAGLSAGDALGLIEPDELDESMAGVIGGSESTGGPAAPGLRPSPESMVVPDRGTTFGVATGLRRIRDAAAAVDQWLREGAPGLELAEDAPAPPAMLSIERRPPPELRRRAAVLEAWSARRFAREGAAAVRQALRAERPWIIAVCDIGRGDAPNPNRLAGAYAAAGAAERLRVETASLGDDGSLDATLREAALRPGLTVLVVRDGDPPTISPESMERRFADVDRLGFTPRQQVTWSIDRISAVRQRAPDDPGIALRDDGHDLVVGARIDRVSDRPGFRMRLRVRPLREQVVVLRTRPPVGRGPRAERLATPRFLHATSAAWRVHLAGWRGVSPGVVSWILAQAGHRMGYHVRLLADPATIGPGRRAWAQLLFTRPRPDEPTPALMARVPFGEADLLIGTDPLETLRAVGTDPRLRVASRPGTSAVVNIGSFIDDPPDASPGRALRHLMPALEATTTGDRFVLDVAAACRARFHTDRLVDAALLGVAFQGGLIPVTVDAMNAAVTEADQAGWGRVSEAFLFGRQLALEPRVLDRIGDDRSDDPKRLIRRTGLILHRRRQHRFAEVLDASVKAMPGLMETDAGRQAMRDFVIALVRCQLWGGLDYARAYADRLVSLYRVDAPETGRRLTRSIILPLAGVMLIRDPFYVAAVVAGAEHRRRTRRWLGIRRARADVVERRFLTRIEFFLFTRRMRVDLRTSDWPARLTKMVRPLVNDRLRGTRRERRLRDDLLAVVDRAIEECPNHRERWENVFRRLHRMALDNRMRSMAISELSVLVTGAVGPPSSSSPAAGPTSASAGENAKSGGAATAEDPPRV
ncbi:MAG: hypothetical protein AB8G96_11550 [Phycisphaerales bacterium]